MTMAITGVAALVFAVATYMIWEAAPIMPIAWVMLFASAGVTVARAIVAVMSL